MGGQNYIPAKDEDFDIWQRNFIIKLSPIATRLGIPEARSNTLESLQGQWTDAWLTASAPATRTSVAVEAKSWARSNYEAEIRAVVRQYITYNDQASDADRISLGLPIHKESRTPAPVPTTYPDYTIDTSVIRQLTIYFHDQNKTNKAKPAGTHGAEILWAIRDTPPTSIEDLTRSGFDTHSPFTLTFDENQRGKIVYFCLRWENTRGLKGPWSEIGSAIIP
ncbi:hypothetical protein [Geminisphaera colitermitum]|uniref:hypothetical protein n=1 Tax=Geminisphaera colitermitum TaxID=1148786 RepID=UPI000158D5A2|nr:hypothetical protein [Geminisphaera colitermitum]